MDAGRRDNEANQVTYEAVLRAVFENRDLGFPAWKADMNNAASKGAFMFSTMLLERSLLFPPACSSGFRSTEMPSDSRSRKNCGSSIPRSCCLTSLSGLPM